MLQNKTKQKKKERRKHNNIHLQFYFSNENQRQPLTNCIWNSNAIFGMQPESACHAYETTDANYGKYLIETI